MFIASLALFVSLAIAGAGASPGRPPYGHPYIKPGPRAVRSPCPGLNVLANHGYL